VDFARQLLAREDGFDPRRFVRFFKTFVIHRPTPWLENFVDAVVGL
jgi:hypothetical protein